MLRNAATAAGLSLTFDPERCVYLGLLREFAELHHLGVIGYCLMSSTIDKWSTGTGAVLHVAGAITGLSGAGSSAGGASSLTTGEMEAGLAGATLRTTQSEISAPVVNRYIDMLRAGDEAPPIKVDGDIIVDGNHRYAAGVLEGKPPATTPGTVAPSQVPKAKPFKDIKVTSTDYGNQ